MVRYAISVPVALLLLFGCAVQRSIEKKTEALADARRSFVTKLVSSTQPRESELREVSVTDEVARVTGHQSIRIQRCMLSSGRNERPVGRSSDHRP